MIRRAEIEPKPEGSLWSDDQWRAIAESGDDILVAAAAGSGKTAVLVERIIRKISNEENGFSVDRLLVATFTKAAAAEMRQRIREALERKLEEESSGEEEGSHGNEHLRRQLALLGRASITTLHSFCLEVIRRYYQLIPIDPGFRILNEHEAEMMRQELLEELLEEKYGEVAEDGQDTVFVRLADWFSGERSDDAVHSLVQRLHDFARSHPWPAQWLRDTAADFSLPDTDALSRTPWVQSILAEAKLTLDGAASQLRQGREIALQPGGPAPYADSLAADLEMVQSLQEALEFRPWAELYDIFIEISFGKLKACKKDSTDPGLQERVKELRDNVKKSLLELQKSLFGRPAEAFLGELHEAAPLMRELAETVIEFGERYRIEKAGRGMVDFSDLEHYCLQILRHEDSEPGHSLPSDAAMEYRDQFDEVLLDEYQDTNSVQEEIVRLISRESPGNRFMVGDMKQSIYRFRLAEPGLFLDKYRSFGSAADSSNDALTGSQEVAAAAETLEPGRPGGGSVIDLARNFRSRLEVVNAVNMIFRQIMDSTVAEISYDERAELVYGAYFPGAAEKGPDTYFAPELLLIDRGASSSSRAEESAEEGELPPQENEAMESETAQLEARAIVRRISQMTGMSGGEPLMIYDKALKIMRPVVYGDIVILLRSARIWTPLMVEELRLEGIPAYGDQNKGYFQATEVEIALSLLQIVDNPRQDIPLAGVLRSPVVNLREEELAAVRLCSEGSFFDAVLAAAGEQHETENGLSGHHALKSDASHAADPAASNEESTAGGGPLADNMAGEAAKPEISVKLQKKLRAFLKLLEGWRTAARQGSLSTLIWRIYGESGYLEWAGGLPGGFQRQNNLTALYDRAVQFENDTNARGLFRFLVFINRLRENGGDLGAAGGTGEETGGVRIMTIHKSKGLEFPVVFLAGMAKPFNRQDLYSPFLMHKELGFGPRFVERETRVSYPTLPYLAISRRSRLELLAEEMRVLYVGLTRPRDKMILVGTVRDLPRTLAGWSSVQGREHMLLEDHMLARGRSYLDWVGPALIRHPRAAVLRKLAGANGPVSAVLHGDASNWSISAVNAQELSSGSALAAPGTADQHEERQAVLEALRHGRSVPRGSAPGEAEVTERLKWVYPYAAASGIPAKTSVTELKSMLSMQEQPSYDLLEESLPAGAEHSLGRRVAGTDSLHLQRPKFMEKRGLSPSERGTAYHTVMQHVPLEGEVDRSVLEATIARLTRLAILTGEQAEAVEIGDIEAFYTGEMGRRLIGASWKVREQPFSYMVPAGEAYLGLEYLKEAASGLEAPAGNTAFGESVLIQGVIDCLFREAGRLILLDYKTDAVLEHQGGLESLKEKYRFQLELYSKALLDILGEPVHEIWLYFFDGGHAVKL
ncbi:UvrD-helicase domain-containing protein [Paenibacillus jilunlii]|uniref:ATP-dependent helicase/nuclease subunit A n=2 Tax=Paenibacillus TaxID=44249 RepID=A0A1G9MQL4_9BACL|nr:UvrD-helicase domain-containing protein [Paenibacillus jilunlii]KWX70386.1 ATP-dependent helicase [Paenibacillus jilunlii]SDL76582.1 DNA helicase/exodeoxyribonuclease V, subunit A [Paenibacillus jilunlii]